MSGVVLRCPTCGTTTTSLGECQACHEAKVRFYCTNHTPGQWLETAACLTCGARFGEPARPRTPPPPAPTPVRPPAASPGRPRTAPWLRERAAGPWSRRTRAPHGEAGAEAPPRRATESSPRSPRLPDLLREGMARARRRPVETRPVADAAEVGMALGGCLMKAVFLVVTLFVVFVVLSLMAGGILLQGYGMYW